MNNLDSRLRGNDVGMNNLDSRLRGNDVGADNLDSRLPARGGVKSAWPANCDPSILLRLFHRIAAGTAEAEANYFFYST